MIPRVRWTCPHCGKTYLIPNDAETPVFCQGCISLGFDEPKELSEIRPKPKQTKLPPLPSPPIPVDKGGYRRTRRKSSDRTLILSIVAGGFTAAVIVWFILKMIPAPTSVADTRRERPRQNASPTIGPSSSRSQPDAESDGIQVLRGMAKGDLRHPDGLAQPQPLDPIQPHRPRIGDHPQEPEIIPDADRVQEEPTETYSPAIAQKPTKEIEFDASGFSEWHPRSRGPFRAKIVQYDLRAILLQNRGGKLFYGEKPIDKISRTEERLVLEVVRYYTRPGSQTPLDGRKDILTIEDLRTHFSVLYGDKTIMPFHAVIFNVVGKIEYTVLPIYAFEGYELEYLWTHGRGVMKSSDSASYRKISSQAGANRGFMLVNSLLPSP